MRVNEQQRAFAGTSAFRTWLAANHATMKALWLIFYKKHAGRRSISYEDAVRQAICFGWIDSIIKRLDDDRYMQKFTPRTNLSKWSRLNIQRAIELIESKQMTAAGYAMLPERGVDTLKKLKPPERVNYDYTPAFILTRLRQEPQASSFFESLAPSYRRNYIAWIMAAKRQETRLRWLERAMEKLHKNEPLGMV